MKYIIQEFIIAISLMTATGVFIHDGRVDKAMTVKNTNEVIAGKNLSTSPHTHSEQEGRPVGKNTNNTPSRPPREQRMKKYLLQNQEPKGRHAFDNHFLPLVD